VPAPVLTERIERTPPHDLDAEVSVLGSMLIDNEVIGEMVTVLRAEDFYREAHRRMYDTVVSLYDAGKGVDAVLLREELRRRGDLDAVGGPEAIVNLLDRVPTAAHAAHYAGIVRDASIRRGILAAADRVVRSAFEGAASGRELLDEAESSFFSLDRDSDLTTAASIGDIMKHVMKELERERPGGDRMMLTGLDTGFTDLNNQTGGLQPGEMIVVAGRPSMGKTSFALNILEHAAVVGKKPVLLFSMEMGRGQIVKNMLTSRARLPLSKLTRGFLSGEDWARISAALEGLTNARIFIDDTAGLTPLALRSRARRMKKAHDIQLVVVDYLQLMASDRRREESRQQEISYISRSLKALARELEVPVIAVSQLNRGVEDRTGHRPMMSDLRESGAIEQDADVVILLHRPEYYLQSELNEESGSQDRRAQAARDDVTNLDEVKGLAEVILAKQRNGPTGTVKMTFEKEFMRFENYSADSMR
jgi:replicative DNA helicase